MTKKVAQGSIRGHLTCAEVSWQQTQFYRVVNFMRPIFTKNLNIGCNFKAGFEPTSVHHACLSSTIVAQKAFRMLISTPLIVTSDQCQQGRLGNGKMQMSYVFYIRTDKWM